MAIYTDKIFKQDPLFKCDYYDEKTYLTNSMLSDFLKDKAYYNRIHNLQTYKPEPTAAQIIGSAVDCLLTEGGDAYRKKYIVMQRRNLKEPIKDVVQLTPAQGEEIFNLYSRIIDQPIYKTLKLGNAIWEPAVFQTILTDDEQKLKGKIDAMQVNRDITKLRIVDFKTSNTIEPSKYFWHCKEYGYFRQMALYQYLAMRNYKIENIECYHLVIEKGEIKHCQLFKFNQYDLEDALDTVFDTVKQVREEGLWNEQWIQKFEDAVELQIVQKSEMYEIDNIADII